MILEANRIYEHDDHGRVVVLGIHDVYNSFDTDGGRGDKIETVVRFARDWDHYGPMPHGAGGEPLAEFESKTTGPIQTDPPEFADDN